MKTKNIGWVVLLVYLVTLFVACRIKYEQKFTMERQPRDTTSSRMNEKTNLDTIHVEIKKTY